MNQLRAVIGLLLISLPVFSQEAGGTAAAGVVAVASLDEQGRAARQGLGVAAGKEGCILTCAGLVDRGRGGVVMTPGGTLHRIQREIYRDELQDLALVETEAAGLNAAALAAGDGLSRGDQVSLVVENGDRLAVQEAAVASLHPFSPRLKLVKLENVELSGLRAGTPIFTREGKLAGLLHAFGGDSEAEKSCRFFLVHHAGQLPAKDAGRGAGPKDAPEIFGSATHARFWQGVAASLRQEWSRAQAQFTAALQAPEKLPEAYFGRGVARLHQGDVRGAVSDLEEAAGLLPGYALACLWLGRAWEGLEKPENARQAYRRAADLAPDLGEAWFRLGRLAYQDGKWREAQDYLERAGDDCGRPAQRWWYLGQIHAAQGQNDSALEAFQQAVKADARFEAAYLETGRMLLDLGRPQDAGLPLARLLELQPRHSEARYLLALAHLASWNAAGAWEQYAALLKIDPGRAARLARRLEKNP
ncbi:MAG: tetratricopeptide repeat protein [Deltaproteobacteria bacterium]|nr:tetratricopeptide repeat protein [Deltaproteobacteria bacterium]